MTRKKKQNIEMHDAIVTSIKCFIEEMSKLDVSKSARFAFAIIDNKNVRVREVDIITTPNKQHVVDMIQHGFKLKAQYVIFTIWQPKPGEDIQSLDLIAYSKESKSVNKTPFRIVENKLVLVQKQEKGFGIFMENDE